MMRLTLLGLAAAAAAAVLTGPASAVDPGSLAFRSAPGAFPQFRSAPGVRVHRGEDRRDDRGRGAYGNGDAYLPYRDYQGDTLWRQGSFNDWWHDRPDRAFPRWVGSNANCERQYWTGSGWRC